MMILLFSATLVFAQGQPPSAEDILAKMQSQLKLTQDQVNAVTPIVKKYAARRQELRQGIEDGTIDKDDMRSQMKVIKGAEKKDLSEFLSTDQISKWEKMLNQMRRHRQGDGGQTQGPLSHDGNGPPLKEMRVK